MAYKVILKHSSIPDKLPSSTSADAGELFVNYASGEGKAFLSIKKADDSMGTFHEDEFWSGITSDLETRVTTIENNIGDIASILDDVLYNF